MEHSVLSEAVLAALDNVESTYFSLARQLPGTTISQRSGYLLARSPHRLSFGNFAAAFDGSASVSETLRDLREDAKHPFGLWIYVADDWAPEGLVDALIAEGYTVRQSLSQLSTGQSGQPWRGLVPCETTHSRLVAAKFMAEQFFPSAPAKAKALVAHATASSAHHLLNFELHTRPLASMMLAESERSVGLYNLCVARNKRKLGYGGQMVRAAMSMAASRGKPLVLQCHGSLRGWYESLGFEYLGEFLAFQAGAGSLPDVIG
ncbi:MAG: hypothetical protein LCH41_14315 [Armatimonadetes bacterium]|nr:hypothetical protein [Armatimonadota bacterium]